MVGLAASYVPPTMAVKIFSAGVAACVADVITFPLDTAKVRLQVEQVATLKKFDLSQDGCFRIQCECQTSSAVRYKSVLGTITTGKNKRANETLQGAVNWPPETNKLCLS